MRKNFGKIITLTLGMVLAFGISAYAAGWQQDATGWWWQNDDESYPVSCWQWLDGNGDGVSESYYFNESGYMLANTTTADGYTVDANGAWTVGGVVQTRTSSTGTLSGTAGSVAGSSTSAPGGTWHSNSTGWWWEYTNGTYPTNEWVWLDGDRDGLLESYYFGENGYMLSNTTTPDGYTVDASGAWVVNGVQQIRGGIAGSYAASSGL